MSLVGLLLPPALLAAAAALAWALEAVGLPMGRPLCAAAGWLALAALAVTWIGGQRPQAELAAPLSVAGTALALRLDVVAAVFELVVLFPFAVLLTFQPRSGPEAALASLAAAASLVTVEAGSLMLTAFGLGTCSSLLLVALRQEEGARGSGHDRRARAHCWLALTGAWLLLVWAAVLLEVAGGTSAYGAAPVTALRAPLFALLALAALLCSGLLPWRTWVSEAGLRARPEAGPLAVALLVPLGLSLLVRTYRLGGGQWPGPALNLALAVLGAAISLGAAARAQAAPSRRAHLAEAVPLGSGMTLMAIALGTPLGMTAAMVALAGVGVTASLAPLVGGRPGARDRPGALDLAGIAIVAGAPPALVFGGWLLSIQAAIEAGAGPGFVGLAAAAAWLLGLAAAARAARLPAGSPEIATAEPGPGAAVAAAAAALGGVGLGALVASVAAPAAGEVIVTPGAAAALAAIQAGDPLAVATASGGWSAALIAGPLVALGIAALVRARRQERRDAAAAAAPAAPPPPALFTPPLAGVPERAAARLSAARLPDQYRSLFRPALLEAAMAQGRTWFWALLTLALAVVVTR